MQKIPKINKESSGEKDTYKMTRKTTLNQIKRKNKQLSSPSPLLGLPQSLVTEIAVRVVSSSITDFDNLKLTCKDIYKIIEEEEGYIYRGACLEKFPDVGWYNKEIQFLKRCCENKNPEALYREGVAQYFGQSRLEIATKCLEEAINLGHMSAYYAMSVIYLISGDELKKQEGIKILGEIKRSESGRIKLKDYRQNLKSIINRIWKSPLLLKGRPVCCTIIQHKYKKRKRTGWLSEDEIIHDQHADGSICEACDSDYEIRLISSSF